MLIIHFLILKVLTNEAIFRDEFAQLRDIDQALKPTLMAQNVSRDWQPSISFLKKLMNPNVSDWKMGLCFQCRIRGHSPNPQET